MVAKEHDAQALPGPLVDARIEIEAGMQVGSQHLGRAQDVGPSQVGVVKDDGAPFAL